MFINNTYQWRKSGDKQLEIAITGDVCPKPLSEKFILQGNSDAILKSVKAVLDKADLRFIQWECVLGRDFAPIIKAGPNLFTDPKCVDFIKAGNFEVALLANNHSGDLGPEGVLSTIDVLKQNKIKFVGAGENAQTAYIPLKIEKNGFKISIINICEHEFGIALSDKAGTNGMDELTNIAQITEEKKTSDLVIVIVHGGNEYNPIPTPRMKKLYRAFAKAGASLVMNIHTHCPQGIEIIDNVPIIYSPGNFYFTEQKPYDPKNFWWSGYLPNIFFDEKGAYKIEITPYKFSDAPGVIEALKDDELKWFLSYINKISKIINSPEADFWYDVWCAYRHLIVLEVMKNNPCDILYEDINNSEALKLLPGIRHYFTCQSHNELSQRLFLLIEQNKIQSLENFIPELMKLCKAELS